VQKNAPGFVKGLGSDHLATKIAKVCQPVAEVQRKLLVQLASKLLGKRRRVSSGGDSNLKITTVDDRRKVEVAERRVIHGVTENSICGGLGKDGAIDRWIVGSGDNQEGSGKVTRLVRALMERKFACPCLLGDAFAGMGRDDGDGPVRGPEGFDLRLGKVARAYDDAASASKLEEDRKE
jgi:hypothetical protein